jgi:hypothetical protein
MASDIRLSERLGGRSAGYWIGRTAASVSLLPPRLRLGPERKCGEPEMSLVPAFRAGCLGRSDSASPGCRYSAKGKSIVVGPTVWRFRSGVGVCDRDAAAAAIASVSRFGIAGFVCLRLAVWCHGPL